MNVDTGAYEDYVLENVTEGLLRLQAASIVIGHNLRTYDVPVIRKLTEGLVDIPDTRIIDTLDMSRFLFPSLPRHRLKDWGEILGVPKMECDGGFDQYSEQMRVYMKRDVELTALLYNFLSQHA